MAADSAHNCVQVRLVPASEAVLVTAGFAVTYELFPERVKEDVDMALCIERSAMSRLSGILDSKSKRVGRQSLQESLLVGVSARASATAQTMSRD